MADAAHTLRAGRARFEHRCVALAGSHADAARVLRERPLNEFFVGQAASDSPRVAFLFPGQGAQHAGMGLAPYEREPLFREVLDRCCELFRPHLALDLREILCSSGSSADAATARLEQTSITQPALFAVEYAFAQWWMSKGLRPAALLGHSVGEYVAACLAGVFSLEDAAGVVAARGRLMQSAPPGAMLAVNLTEAGVQPYLAAGCDLAAVNAADSCVLSGTVAAIDTVERDLKARNLMHRRLRVSHAFHSALLDPVLEEFERLLSQTPLHAPTIPFVSNVTGRWITPEQARDPAYWMRHLRRTVRFADGVGELLRTEHLLLEIGPGETLSRLARRHPQADSHRFIASSLQPVRCAAALWTKGVEFDGFFSGTSACRRVPLPLYPFERQSYWVPAPDHAGAANTAVDDLSVADADHPEHAMRDSADIGAGYARPELKTAYEPPGNELESSIADLWRSFLKIAPIGVNDSLFDLGGDSLLAIQLLARVQEQYDVELRPEQFLESPTVAALAVAIESRLIEEIEAAIPPAHTEVAVTSIP